MQMMAVLAVVRASAISFSPSYVLAGVAADQSAPRRA